MPSVEWAIKSGTNVCFIHSGIWKIPTWHGWSSKVRNHQLISPERTETVTRLVNSAVKSLNMDGTKITVTGEEFGAIFAAAYCRLATTISKLIGKQK